MCTEDARKYVEAGLHQRKLDREERAREAELDHFEEEMISFCNKHSAEAKITRSVHENQDIIKTMSVFKRKEQKKQDDAADLACRRFGYACLVVLLICAVTPLPFYAGAAIIFDMAIFLVAYIAKVFDFLGVSSNDRI